MIKLRQACRPLHPGRALHSPVISDLGPRHQLAIASSPDLHTDRPETHARPRIRGLVPNPLLIANIVRHLPADFIPYVESLRKNPARRSVARMNKESSLPELHYCAARGVPGLHSGDRDGQG